MAYPSYTNPFWWPSEDPTPQSELPAGQLVRNPQTMGQEALRSELQSLTGIGQYGGRAPASLGGVFAGLGGIPGLGIPLSLMAGAGQRNRAKELFMNLEQRTYPLPMIGPRGGAGPGVGAQPAMMAPAFNAVGMMDRIARETGTHQGGGGSDMASPGLGDWDDETGFGGA